MTKLPYLSFASDSQKAIHFLLHNQAGEEWEDFYFNLQKSSFFFFFNLYLAVCVADLLGLKAKQAGNEK